MKIINVIAKVLLTLICIMPVLGAIGVFPPPTPQMYGSQTAYNFIKMLMDAKYIMAVMAVVFVLSAVALWTKREALAAILLLPLTVNIVGFHAFVDSGLLTAGAMMANILAILNIYFLLKNKNAYKNLLNIK